MYFQYYNFSITVFQFYFTVIHCCLLFPVVLLYYLLVFTITVFYLM
jgi:hypothetical protein